MVVLEAFDVPHGTGNSTKCAGFYRDGDGKAFILLAHLCDALLVCYPDVSKYEQKHRSRFEAELQTKGVEIIEEMHGERNRQKRFVDVDGARLALFPSGDGNGLSDALIDICNSGTKGSSNSTSSSIRL